MVGPSRPSSPIMGKSSLSTFSSRQASRTRGISLSWEKARALSRTMRSSSVRSPSRPSGSSQLKSESFSTWAGLGWDLLETAVDMADSGSKGTVAAILAASRGAVVMFQSACRICVPGRCRLFRPLLWIEHLFRDERSQLCRHEVLGLLGLHAAVLHHHV